MWAIFFFKSYKISSPTEGGGEEMGGEVFKNVLQGFRLLKAHRM